MVGGYERELRDVLSIQSDVASAIAREIRVKVAPEESTRLASRGPVDPEAYQPYLQGRIAFLRFTPGVAGRGGGVLQPRDRQGPAVRARLRRPGRHVHPARRPGAPAARGDAEGDGRLSSRALELDPNLAEAYASLGQVKLFYEFDFEGAGAEYRRAPREEPGLAAGPPGLRPVPRGPGAHATRRWRRRTRLLELDPVSSSSGCMRSRLLYYARQYDEAIAQYSRDAGGRSDGRGILHVRDLRFRAAGAVRRRRSRGETHQRLVTQRDAAAGGARSRLRSDGQRRARREKVVRAMEELAKRRFISEHDFALAYSGWNREEALRWLEKAYERPGRTAGLRAGGLGVGRPARGPRFQGIVRKIGIPE